jgi:hypothetical protein
MSDMNGTHFFKNDTKITILSVYAIINTIAINMINFKFFVFFCKFSEVTLCPHGLCGKSTRSM